MLTSSLLVPTLLDIYWNPNVSAGLGLVGDGAVLGWRMNAGGRQNVWMCLVRAVVNGPIFGAGFGGVFNVLRENASQCGPTLLPFSFAHNIILDFSIWWGLPLTIASVWLIGNWYLSVWRYKGNPEVWLALAVATIIGVHSFFEYPHAYIYFIVPFGFALGYANECRSIPVKGLFLKGGVILTMFFGLVVMADVVQQEEMYRSARFNALRIGDGGGEVNVSSLLLNQLEEASLAIQMHPSINPLDDKQISLLIHAMRRYPWPGLISRYAQVAVIKGSDDEAQNALESLRVIYGSRMLRDILLSWRDLPDSMNKKILEMFMKRYYQDILEN